MKNWWTKKKMGAMNGGNGGAKSKKPTRKQILLIGGAVGAVVVLGMVIHQAQNDHSSAGVPSAPLLPPVARPVGAATHAPTANALLAQKTAIPGVLPVVAPATSPWQLAQQAQALLSGASGDTATLVKTWPGPNGLTGIEYTVPGGNMGVAWENIPAGLVMIGTLVGSDGTNYNTKPDFDLAASVTGSQGATAAARSVSAAPAMTVNGPQSPLAAMMTGGNGFVVGSAGPQVTVFIDPNSANGNKVYMKLVAPSLTGKIRVRYVPIAVKTKASLNKAEQILAAPDPAKELDVDERLFSTGKRNNDGGGIKGVANTLPMMSQVDTNTALLAAAGYVGTVDLVYCDKRGLPQVAQGSQALAATDKILSLAGSCK
ncbi:hypothetical protein HF282_02855 [Acidithiobacillus ferrooxidans]|nr:hypothetical protein [Acidithiobacillus ferrooxidans]